MSRDWVVWACCFGLFAAGAVWAQVPLSLDNTKISNTLSSLASLATIVGVIFAGYGINAWRIQLKSNNRHDVSREVIVSFIIFYDRIASMAAFFSHADGVVADGRFTKDSYTESYWLKIQSSMAEAKEADAKAFIAALDCSLVIDGESQKTYERFSDFGDKLYKTLSEYLKHAELGSSASAHDLAFLQSKFKTLHKRCGGDVYVYLLKLREEVEGTKQRYSQFLVSKA